MPHTAEHIPPNPMGGNVRISAIVPEGSAAIGEFLGAIWELSQSFMWRGTYSDEWQQVFIAVWESIEIENV